MTVEQIRVLLVEKEPKDVTLIRQLLAKAADVHFQVKPAADLVDGLEHAVKGGIDVILADISVPVSRGGVDPLVVIHDYAPDIPLVVVVDARDDVGTKALALGAQAYAVKGQMSTALLMHLLVQAVERRRMAKEAAVGEGHFRALIEKSNDAILVLGADGVMRYGSPSFPRMLGYGETENIGFSAFDFIHPDDLQKGVSYLTEAMAKPGASVSGEMRVRHRDGSWRHMEVTGTNYLDNPAVAGIVLNIHDITERRKADEALRDSEQRYRLITDNMTDVVFMMDFDFHWTYVTPSIERLLGFTYEESANVPIEQIMTLDSIAHCRKILAEEMATEMAGQRRDPKAGRTLELELYRKDGTTVCVEMNVTFLRDAEGKPTAIMGVVRDISERRQAEEAMRQSEERYRLIADNMTDLTFVLDLNLRVKYISPSVTKLLGYAPEEALGVTLDQVIPPKHLERGAKLLAEELAVEKSGEKRDYLDRNLELEFFRKDGTRVWVEEALTFIRDAKGEPTAILGVARDISQRKKAEEATRVADEKLRDALEKLRLSHEALSTPVIQIWDGVLALPLIGLIDDRRAQKVVETLLRTIVETQSEVIILDVTGVASIDTQVANYLVQTAKSVSLLGAQCILTGIQPEVAQTVIALGMDMNKVTVKRDLRDGLRWALQTQEKGSKEGYLVDVIGSPTGQDVSISSARYVNRQRKWDALKA